MSTTREEMKAALQAYKAAHGHPAMRALLEDTAGVSAISEVRADKVASVIAAIKLAPSASAKKPKTLTELVAPAYARFNNPPKVDRSHGE